MRNKEYHRLGIKNYYDCFRDSTLNKIDKKLKKNSSRLVRRRLKQVVKKILTLAQQ